MEPFKVSVTKEELSKKKLFLATPMFGGSCIPSTSLIETEDGFKTIKEIVDTRYKGKVKSFSKERNCFEFSKVTNHFVRKNDGSKKWIKLVLKENGINSGRETLICTDDHLCSYVSDVFNPLIDYKEARELKNGFIVREPCDKVGKITNTLFNNEQLQVLIGTIFGDTTIKKSGFVRCVHSNKQKKYIEFKANILNGTVKESLNIGGYVDGQLMYVSSIGANVQTHELRKMLYDDKTRFKELIDKFTEISLSFMYMDDGYICYDKRNLSWKPFVCLCTDSFSENEVDMICNRITEMGIECKKIVYKKFFRIKILDHDAFFDRISRYACKSMSYKFPERYHDTLETHVYNKEKLSFGLSKIEGTKEWTKTSLLYDIEVEKNHNFVTNGFLIHNCVGSYARGVADLAAICQHWGIPLQIYYLFNESLIPRARNYACDEFMRSECTHFLFIDADIGFKANDVLAMLAMMTDDSPYDVLGAPYPKKCISWEKIKQAVDKGFADENPNELSKFVGDYVFNPTGETRSFSVLHPVEVLETGTGFMMVKRKTFERFQEAYPASWYRPDHVRTTQFDGKRMVMAYFDCIIDRGFTWDDVFLLLTKLANKQGTIDELAEIAQRLSKINESASLRYLSEDYYFCQLVRKVGMKVWLAPWIELEHTGSFVFGGSLKDIARLGASATADPALLDKFKDKK